MLLLLFCRFFTTATVSIVIIAKPKYDVYSVIFWYFQADVIRHDHCTVSRSSIRDTVVADFLFIAITVNHLLASIEEKV